MADSKREKAATIYDVAKAVGVSPSTVSRAFSRPGRVSSKTAEKIHKIAAELGYRTESVYRHSVATDTKLFGVLVTDVTNPFFFSIIRGAQHVANRSGYSIVLIDSEESGELERTVIDRTIPLLAGLIVASSRLSDTALRSVAKSVPVIVLNRVVSGLPCVVTDNARGVRRALEHLAEYGHRRVCYVAGPTASWADGARWRAFREACFELDLVDSHVGPTPPTVRGGFSTLRQVIEQRATAVVTYNDQIAIGLMRAAKTAGVSIPGDLSVIGFDNISSAELVTPGLTTVAAPLAQIGERGALAVLASVNNQGSQPREFPPIEMPMKLMVRESTGPVRRLRTLR